MKLINSASTEKKPFMVHIQELRKRFIFLIISFFMFFIVSYPLAPFFVDFIKKTATDFNIELNIFQVTESVSLYVKSMLLISIALSFPILIYQIFRFISPALSPFLYKVSLCIIPIVSALFTIGATIGLFFITPLLMGFFLNVSSILDLNPIYNFTNYFNFVFSICLIFGLFFEMPVLIVFLTILRLITPQTLRKMRVVAYPVLTFLAIIATPPDFISDLIVMTMCFLLYEFSIVSSKSVYHFLNKHLEGKEVKEIV